MKTPRDLSGAELAECLCRRWGTLNSILRAVSRHKGVGRQDIIDSL